MVPTKQYVREKMQTKVEVPPARGQDTSVYAFQWLPFKPQAHAVEQFVTNQVTRGVQSGDRTHADVSKGS
jgi:hypothetical protein